MEGDVQSGLEYAEVECVALRGGILRHPDSMLDTPKMYGEVVHATLHG